MLRTVHTMLEASSYPSCWFLGFPVPVNGCAETRVYRNSGQMIHCVPIKRRGNLCFEENTSQVRVPNQLLSISQKITTHISSPCTLHSTDLSVVSTCFYLPAADNFRFFGNQQDL